jgi:hypothetical protein
MNCGKNLYKNTAYISYYIRLLKLAKNKQIILVRWR